MWIRLRRPPQDDPRLSRGLQLLQTKITVLEDLSDRTEQQVKQLSGVLDQKSRSVQNKILEAEQQILKIDHSMHKSMEVAEIFHDKIPHQEILERQRTIEYVKAARMAHSGLSVDEIAAAVPLPREQIELIAKFNREQLMFDENQLPQWATRPASANSADNPGFALNSMNFVNGLEVRPQDPAASAKIETDFRQAVQSAKLAEANSQSQYQTQSTTVMAFKATAQTLKEKLVSTAEDMLRTQAHYHSQAQAAGLPPSPSAPASVAAMGPAWVKKISDNRSMPTVTLEKNQSASVLKEDTGQVKKVVFPRIEK